MNYISFMEFLIDMRYSINSSYSAKNTLLNIFLDYIKKQNINTDDVKSIYPQNFFNSNPAAIIVALPDCILMVRYKSDNTEQFTNLAHVRIIKKSCIKEIEMVSKSDTYFKEIDLYSRIQADIKLDSKEVITLSNIDDSNEQWKADYSTMILEFISFL